MVEVYREKSHINALIQSKRLKVTVPEIHHNKTYFFVMVKHADGDESPLLVHISHAIVDKNPCVFDSGYMYMDISLSERDKETIQCVEHGVLEKISKSKQWRNIIHEVVSPLSSSSVLRTRNFKTDNIEVYADGAEDLDIVRDIAARDRISFVLHVDRLVVTPHGGYFHYSIIQLKKHSFSKLSRSVLREDDGGEQQNRYQQMLKVGIPIEAVRHKMRLDGCDDFTIDQLKIELLHSQNIMPPPPPPPLPPPPLLTTVKTGAGVPPLMACLSDIKSGNFKLKSMQPPTKGRVLKYVDVSKKVPSLAEIQSALKNLRSLTKVNARDTTVTNDNEQ